MCIRCLESLEETKSKIENLIDIFTQSEDIDLADAWSDRLEDVEEKIVKMKEAIAQEKEEEIKYLEELHKDPKKQREVLSKEFVKKAAPSGLRALIEDLGSAFGSPDGIIVIKDEDPDEQK